jgi:hypothetical protein
MTKRSKSIGRSRRNEQKRRRTVDAGQPRPVIAVINTSDDLVLALRNRLLDEGYEIVIGHIRDIKM